MKHFVLMVLVALLPLGSALAGDGQAKVITSYERPTECISPVEIYKIDGEEVLVNSQMVELDAGEHSLRGRALRVNTTYCRAPGGPTRVDIPDLVHEFEAGKTYWVGLDHSSHSRREWRLVVWKEES